MTPTVWPCGATLLAVALGALAAAAGLFSGGAAWFLHALIRRADAGVSDRPTEERGS